MAHDLAVLVPMSLEPAQPQAPCQVLRLSLWVTLDAPPEPGPHWTCRAGPGMPRASVGPREGCGPHTTSAASPHGGCLWRQSGLMFPPPRDALTQPCVCQGVCRPCLVSWAVQRPLGCMASPGVLVGTILGPSYAPSSSSAPLAPPTPSASDVPRTR